ncbi:MAG: hypothetical protein AB8V46_02045 [Candidatus Midichloria sp.]
MVIITTIFATDIGASSTMGTVSRVYTFGIFFAVTRLFVPFFWLLMAQMFGKNIDQFQGYMSISDIMEHLYGKVARWITNIASIVTSIGLVALQATAMGCIIHYFFQIPTSYGTIISTSILALYSAFGRIRAVAYTDVFQFVILIIAIPLACSFAYREAGGYENIMSSLPKEMLSLNLTKDNIQYLVVFELNFLQLITANCWHFHAEISIK